MEKLHDYKMNYNGIGIKYRTNFEDTIDKVETSIFSVNGGICKITSELFDYRIVKNNLIECYTSVIEYESNIEMTKRLKNLSRKYMSNEEVQIELNLGFKFSMPKRHFELTDEVIKQYLGFGIRKKY